MRDTTDHAARLQARIQESLGGAGRLRVAYDLSTVARALALAGLRARHPSWTTAQLYLALNQPHTVQPHSVATPPASAPRGP